MFTVGSLFSGIGGIDLAFSWAGFDVRWQVEIDDWCKSKLAKNAPAHWPNARMFSDVKQVSKAELSTVDIMAGGFPCQDVSVAGQRKGIKEDTRSGLWFDFARLIGDLRPRVALLENVPGILTQDGIRVVADLTALGYDTEWGIIPASAVGASHRRERWFCLAYPKHNGSTATAQRRIYAEAIFGASLRAFVSEQPAGLCSLATMAYTGRQRRESGGIDDREGASTLGQASHQRSAEYDSVMVNAERTRSQGDTQRQIQSSEITTKRCEKLDDTTSTRFQRQERSQAECPATTRSSDWNLKSRLGIAANGIPGWMVGRWPARPSENQHDWEAPRTTTEKIKDRAKKLKALGNAVVPQVVYPIAVAIREYLDGEVAP